MADKKIIAIQGLPGSGKSIAINYLMEKYGWPKVYFGEVTFDEIEKRGLEINEKNERIVREELRKKFGLLHYAEEVIKKIDASADQPIILVESLYSWDEYLFFKKRFKNNFYLIAVYASPKTRYLRLANRPIRPLTEEMAKSRDHAQITNLSQAGPIVMSNFTIINEGSPEQLHEDIDKAIKKII